MGGHAAARRRDASDILRAGHGVVSFVRHVLGGRVVRRRTGGAQHGDKRRDMGARRDVWVRRIIIGRRNFNERRSMGPRRKFCDGGDIRILSVGGSPLGRRDISNIGVRSGGARRNFVGLGRRDAFHGGFSVAGPGEFGDPRDPRVCARFCAGRHAAEHAESRRAS